MVADQAIDPFEYDETLWLIDTGLYRVDRHTLVLADLHLGYEESMHRQGVLLPETRFEDLFQRFERVCSSLRVSAEARLDCLIVNGDLRHAFGPLNDAEWRELNAFFERVSPFCRRLIVIEGNHDPTMTVFAKRFSNVEIRAEYRQQGWLYVHGDKIPTLHETTSHIVIGHEHPALSLQDPVTGRRERFKAFLKGAFRERTLWVLPSCNTLIPGTDLSKEGVFSPILRESGRQNCEAYVRDDRGRIYAFGALQQLI